MATIIEMVHHTRLDCVIGAAALDAARADRGGASRAARQAFGRKLIDQPLMQNVLADLAIESEAATLLMMRLARAIDEGDRMFARLAVAAGKILGIEKNAGSRGGGARMPGREWIRRRIRRCRGCIARLRSIRFGKGRGT